MLVIVGFLSCKQLEIKHVIKIKTTLVKIENNEVLAIGNILDLGENEISDYGFCYAENKQPEITDSRISLNSTDKTGEFKANLIGLNANSRYSIRAYAVSNNKILYGNLLELIIVPNLMALNIDSVIIADSKSIFLKGSISGIGNIKIIDYGFCWSNSPNPSIANYHYNFGNLLSDTNFETRIIKPFWDSVYYLKAFIKLDDKSIFYSPEKYATVKGLKIRTGNLILNDINSIYLIGYLDQIGNGVIQEYGFCWSLYNSFPDINENKKIISNKPEIAPFSSIIPLIKGKTYYSRAYAIIDGEVIYGNVQSKSF